MRIVPAPIVLVALTALTTLAGGGAQAAQDCAKSSGTLIELSAEASRKAANDLGRASAFFEATDGSPKELAKKVNAVIARALADAKAYPGVKVQSGGVNTWPNYDKAGHITGWRMRSTLEMESRDITALSELLGQLQTTLGVSQIAFTPSPETRRKVEDETILDAMAAFEARAKLVAGKKTYRIKLMTIGTGGGVHPPFAALSRVAMASDAAPLEAGESQIGITVSGKIELPE